MDVVKRVRQYPPPTRKYLLYELYTYPEHYSSPLLRCPAVHIHEKVL